MSPFLFCVLGWFIRRWFGRYFLKKIKNSVDKVYGLCYYIYVAYDGNELNTVCGSGGTADALASGASGGDPVEVQILSTAPFLFMNFIPKTRSWWNGRHATLRGWWEKSRVGSNPTDRTNIELMRTYVNA